ncbi:MAG TPA: hypothetical protein VJ876_04565 [Bacteroidales bacterium]|nr:hypothetical protein [Bacteroidales bacterium]
MGIIEIFLQPLFWMIMGMLYALVIVSARYWARDLGLNMNWWKWLLTGLWFVMLSLFVAGGMTLIGENEIQGGIYFLGFFLVLMLILGVGLWRLLTFNRKKADA